MSGGRRCPAGRRVATRDRHDAVPIPHPNTGRPSIDQLYRAAPDRASFRSLVEQTWPLTQPGRPTRG